MVNVFGATGSLLPVLLSSKALADKPQWHLSALAEFNIFRSE